VPEQTLASESLAFDPEELTRRYQLERDRRIREDAESQFVEVTNDAPFANTFLADDPYSETIERDPIRDVRDVIVIGGAFGAGVEISVQLAMNGGNWNCIDLADVGVSALVGFFAPGAGTAVKNVWTSGKAAKNLGQQLERARTANRRNKIRNRINKHRANISDEVLTQVVWQGSKQIGKKAANYQGNSCECGS